MRLKSFALGTCLVLLSLSAQAMLVNGDFKDGVSIGTSTGARSVSGGDILGWIASGGRTVDYMVDGAFGPGFSPQFGPGLASQDGNNFVDLTGSDNGFGSISQAISTVAGQTYQLSFWIGGTDLFTAVGDSGLPGVTAALSGAFSQVVTGSRNSATDWQRQTILFTGTGGLATLSFTGSQADNCCFIGLDNVRVTALPEPETLLLFVFGLLATVQFTRRRV